MTSTAFDTDVLILGAGPVGLTLANLLGGYGIRTTVADAGDKLIDYPRGVGLDDESLRTFQTAGVVEQVLPHTTPQHIMRMVNGTGQVLANAPPAPRSSAGRGATASSSPRSTPNCSTDCPASTTSTSTSRTPWSATSTTPTVTATVASQTAPETTIRARYLVGCDGGRSITRKSMGVTFEGQSSPTRFLVVDVRNDPLGTPNAYLGADPVRPFVSIGLPHGVRRFEFMIFDDETDEQVADPRSSTSCSPATCRTRRASTSSGSASTPCTPASPERSARATC